MQLATGQLSLQPKKMAKVMVGRNVPTFIQDIQLTGIVV